MLFCWSKKLVFYFAQLVTSLHYGLGFIDSSMHSVGVHLTWLDCKTRNKLRGAYIFVIKDTSDTLQRTVSILHVIFLPCVGIPK